jgi:hypothetical protein
MKMKRITPSLLLVGLAALGCAQSTAKLVATFQGHDIGTATFTVTPQRDRSFIQTTLFSLSVTGNRIEISTTERIDGEGRTLHSESKQVANGVVQRNVEVKFTAKGAEVTDKKAGTKKMYPLPAGADTRDPSGLWFLVTRPKAGQTATAISFSIDKNAWRKTKRKYIGDKPFTLDGKKIMGHQVQDESDGTSVSALVDDRGLPLDLEISNFHFARK